MTRCQVCDGRLVALSGPGTRTKTYRWFECVECGTHQTRHHTVASVIMAEYDPEDHMTG